MHYRKIERICMPLYLSNISSFSGVKHLIKTLNLAKYPILTPLGHIKCWDLFSTRGPVFKSILTGFQWVAVK